MSNRYAWIALGFGAYVAFVLATFPAAAAYRWFAPPELRLSGIEGTLWNGRAAMASAGDLPLSDLRWNLEALPLLTGRAAGRVQARLAEGFVDSRVAASLGGTIVLRDGQLGTSLESLAATLPIGDVQGQLAVRLERAVLRDGWPVELAGQARLTRLTVPAYLPSDTSASIALGDYEIVPEEATDESVTVRFRDTGGPLEVAGTVRLDRGLRYQLDAAAAPRANAPPEIVTALDFMAGEPGPDGRRPFELTGSL